MSSTMTQSARFSLSYSADLRRWTSRRGTSAKIVSNHRRINQSYRNQRDGIEVANVDLVIVLISIRLGNLDTLSPSYTYACFALS